MSLSHTRVAIIGSGPAGYTAAIYAGRALLEPIVFAGPEPGGQPTATTEIENFPGFPEGIMGPELMDRFQKQALRFGATVVPEAVTRVDFSSQPFKLEVGSQAYAAESVIVATGALAKWLGIESEQRLRGKGVSSCATCDGFFFRGKDVVVIGGGDSALEEANFLTKFANQVTVIHRRAEMRASKIMQDRAAANKKISFIWNSEVVEVLGEQSVTGVRIKNNVSGEDSMVACQGVFVAIGHAPNTDIFKGIIDLDEKGYIVVKDRTKTNIEGVFAGGDVRDHVYRQAITASGFGCMAAMDAEKWLAEQEDKIQISKSQTPNNLK